MENIRTVEIRALAPVCSLAEAMRTWHGFAELTPPVQFSLAHSYVMLPPPASSDPLQGPGDESVRLGAIGCSFVSDLEVCGSGYLFNEGRYVREFVHTSDVGLEWLERPDFPDNPIINPPTDRVVVEAPALLVFGPGSRIFGHWLLDFLPRIVIAQQLLGPALDDFVLPLPSDTPGWVAQMIQTFCGIGPDRILHYARDRELLCCPRACLPSFGHNGSYVLHPMMRQFYDRFGDPGAPRAKRRICLSRRDQERHTFSAWRIFEAREQMEEMAVRHGFEIVQPEQMSFPEQIELFRSADCILGEHGSGMHAAVFADPGTIVATVGLFNSVQLYIAAAFGHQFICLSEIEVLESVPNRPFRFTASKDDLLRMLEMIDTMHANRGEAV
jgi:hypothetical protein